MRIERREFLAGLAAAGGASLLRSTGASAQPRARRYSKPVIDAHAHWYGPTFVDLLVKEGAANGAKISGPDKNGDYTAKAPDQIYYSPNGSTFTKNMRDVPTILKLMDERDIDMYALSMTHPKVYWAPPAFGLKLSQAANDDVSAVSVKYPKRFVGTIHLPMQDPKLALQELERAAKLPNMRAINLGEHVEGKNLSNKEFWPIWARCEALGLPLFLHNLNPFGGERLVQDGVDLINLLGNPFEATVASMSFIMSGCLDEFPKLDIYLPHAGGALPWLVWRTDYSLMGNVTGGGPKKLKLGLASAYLRRFHYDLILHSEKYMRVLIDMVGADRVVCGTDFPQGMGVPKPVDFVESIPGITMRERELILCENPARLLRI